RKKHFITYNSTCRKSFNFCTNLKINSIRPFPYTPIDVRNSCVDTAGDEGRYVLMNNSLIIGQYVPGDSLVHRLDPRTKITIIFFFVVVVFFANSVGSYGVLTIFALTSMFTTRIPIRFIMKGLTPVWFLIIFT